MNTRTRFSSLVKKMVLALAVCGMMGATDAFAQSGDIIGFYSNFRNSTFTAPGTTVDFTIRIAGTIVVSNLFNTAFVQPQIRMEVGSDGASSTAYATLKSTSWTGAPFTPLNRTDMTFSYTIRPGDMADPLRIFGTALGGYSVVPNQCWIYSAYPGNISSNVVWKLNHTVLWNPVQDGSVGMVYGDWDMSYQNVRLRTLSFDAANSPATLVARATSRTWRIQSGATNSVPVKVMVWTPHTNVLQIVGALPIGSIPWTALEVTIPAGSDYVDFPIRGLDTNAIPTVATVYAQRPSDYDKNLTAVTNFISRAVTITAPGAPTINLEFSNGLETQTLSETNEVDTGSFQIVLSEAETNRVYVDFAIAHQPSTLTNIIITPQPGGYYVEAGQERSDPYYFSVINGTRESSRSPYVRITPSATNTTKYTMNRAGILNIANVAPSVLWYPPAAGDENTPVAFDWSDLADVNEDLARGIAFRWNFGDGGSITQTNFTTFGQITHTYTGLADVPRNYTVALTITDMDGGTYTLPSQTITISPAPKPANVSVVVNRADFTYAETNALADYTVVLSQPALQDTWVSVVGQYLMDNTSSDDTLTLTVTNNILIPKDLSIAGPFTMIIKDGTFKTSTGIKITPTITNAAAQVQYPGAYYGIVRILNIAPGLDANPTCLPTATPVSPYNSIQAGKPFTFKYRTTDVTADKTGAPPNAITVEYQFDDGTTTNITGVLGSVTKTFPDLGLQSVTMIARDKDGGETTLTFPILVVAPLPPPSIVVVANPVFNFENDNMTLKSLTIQLSEAPTTNSVQVFLDVTPVPNPDPLNGSITVPASVTFNPGQTTRTVYYQVQDGTALSSTPGFLVTPRIAVGAPGDSVYQQRDAANIYVQNVAPVFMWPLAGSTNAIAATVDQPALFNWDVEDVSLDKPSMQVVWNWGDGSPSDTVVGASGAISHTYVAPGTMVVNVIATDKDGGVANIRFQITVKDSKKVIVLPIGPNSVGYNGFTYPDLGTGTVSAVGASLSVWDPVNMLFRFYYDAEAVDANLIATPGGPDANGRKYYFFAWNGPLAAFQDTTHVTKPLAPSSTVIYMPSGTTPSGGTTATTLNGNTVQLSAIFTVAYSAGDVESPAGVNNGDLNQDGIPDRLVQKYFIDPATASGTETTLNAAWFLDLGGFNEDLDFLPVYPTGDNQGVLDFRPVPNPRTTISGIPVNAFTAFMEVRGYDGNIAESNVSGIDPFDDDPGTDPKLLDTDEDGYPDGWEYWFWYQSNLNRMGSRYNPFNNAQGDVIDYSEIILAFDPMSPRNTYSDRLWVDDFDNDGLLDIEELTLGTDPTRWDTDNDIMADGWEILHGFNPQDGRDGSYPSRNNPDGDYFAIATAIRRHIQVVVTNDAPFVGADPVVLTNHYFRALTPTNAPLTTAYRYGNDLTGPWAVGRVVPEAMLTPSNLVERLPDVDANPLILHYQVRDEYLFDPRTAWIYSITRFGSGASNLAGWPYDDAGRFGPLPGNAAPNTRPFTAIDEYLLFKFMYEHQLNGMLAINSRGWLERYNAAKALYDSNNATFALWNEERRNLIQESWTRFCTHPHTPDTDATPEATDAVPDGWELYTAISPGGPLPFNAFAHTPWFAEVAPETYQREFWGTDSLPPYVNPNLYLFGLTNSPMVGIVSIIRPIDHADNYWINKFWPTDPWTGDTDGDGIGDLGETAFIYGFAVDSGGSCIAGGGLNPCSIDTDRDALPDTWESAFAGSAVADDGSTNMPPVVPGQGVLQTPIRMTIANGQDGSVSDATKDSDLDGLLSYQEYLTQALRCYRYDVPLGNRVNDTNVVDAVTKKIGQPMNISFETAVFFEEVTNLWDQCYTASPLSFWWMRPAGNGYCSTSPQMADSDKDGMDDYYEMFHGLNPLLGYGLEADRSDDLVAKVYSPKLYAYHRNSFIPSPGFLNFDFVQYPWLNGMPGSDPDADGLVNVEEMLAANIPLPEPSNTDPSPMWMTDPSNPESLTARFYVTWNGRYNYRPMFFWPPSLFPTFTYPFEMNEGYDTDNDGVSDKDELVTNRGSMSDPRDSEDPIRRQALWCSGDRSAAVTPYIYADANDTVVGQLYENIGQAYRSFTVELWARPEWDSSANEQILIERTFDYGQTDNSQAMGSRLRRNFQIGITTDGRIFGRFDNAGGHDEHTDSVKLIGEKVSSNTWVHIAIRMDGREQAFSLLVNGVSQGQMETALIPATGVDPAFTYPDAENPNVYRNGALVVGAGVTTLPWFDIGIGGNSPLIHPLPMVWTNSWNDYSNYYCGWIDEVRIWDGARSNQEINDNFRKGFTRKEVVENRSQILSELNTGAGRNALSTNNFISPILMNLYTFNNLFSAHADPYVAQVPRGFNSWEVDWNRPLYSIAGATVRWWDDSPLKSSVYNNYHYVPWIENVVAHLPPATSITDTNGNLTFVNDNGVLDSVYWTRRAAGDVEVQNSFANNNNPYGFYYHLADTYRLITPPETPLPWDIVLLDNELKERNRGIDLLPIGDAWAKQCTDFWDNMGPSGSWLESSDTLSDGLPIWWVMLHATSAGWTDLYTGSDSYYSTNRMTNGEVYQRDLAKGMLPSATTTTDYTAAYQQTADSNGDGMPDWWKRMYGLAVMEATGENGPVGDVDKDALSNYSEYLITEVYKLRHSSPVKFKTHPDQPVSDYFMKPKGAKLNFGAMFSDHDFIEGWWEELYSPTSANPYIFDAKTDYDSDGWSNWAEARYSQAVASVRPDLRELVMVTGITTFEYPIPVVDTFISYKGVQTSGNLVLQAFASSAMVGMPDATWNISFGQVGTQQNSIPLGFYADKTIRTRLSPGSVVPGTIHIQLTDTWTGETAETGFDMNGIIYSMSIDGIWDPIGTVNYITGEMVLEMSTFKDTDIILDEAAYPADRNSYIESDVSYFEMTYDTQLPTGWPQHIYLGRAATGALKEGKNYFFGFIDVNANATWDAGEPAGIPTPFETDIGWDENRLEIQLTDYTPYNLRFSLSSKLRSEDVVFGTGGTTTTPGGETTGASPTYTRVRIRRATVQTSNFSEAIVFDKVIYGRDYIHEGDLMTMPGYGGYGLDWNFGARGIQTPLSVGAISYQIYVGNNTVVTNNTRVAVFTNRFDGARAIPMPVSPTYGSYVYTARPTFSWSVVTTNNDSGYNAFALELRRGSKTGPLVYPITIRQAPIKDVMTDNYVWDAPFYMGDKNTVNNGVYYWRVQAMNPRYSSTNSVDAEWSTWRMFRWDVNATLAPMGTATNINGSSSGYGQLRTVVKYFGAVTNTVGDRIVLQAFKNRGFTGNPAAQYAYSVSQNSILTNQSLSVTNAITMRGLTPGVYYVRAFLDSNTNSVMDSWESWGYANYYGENKAIYDVRPITISYSALTPQVTVYLEDMDTDHDWFPDAYEYELNRTAANFLELTGPSDSWTYRGDSEINPSLDADSFIEMVFAMSMGSIQQQSEIVKLIAVDGEITKQAVLPTVSIDNLSLGGTHPTLDLNLTPAEPAQYSSTLFAAFTGASSAPAPQTQVYTYYVKFSNSLATPKADWQIVESGTVSIDENGVTVKTPDPASLKPVTGANGFFTVEMPLE